MARGLPPPGLPIVEFKKIEDDILCKPYGVNDLTSRAFGYNQYGKSDFERPDHYTRHIEPLESDLARQVEYDMDEQDQLWLDEVNVERRKDQLNSITCETFEVIMDRLEKEWFDLTKNIPKTDFALPSEDSTCAICDDSEGENSNAIVFCDGCNLAVHQDCYGVPYIPEGQWLCRKCTVSPEVPVSCILCPAEGGAFKQTITGEWVHLLCAIWVPETQVVNETFMEPITNVPEIPRNRWKLKCSICEIRMGACIQCSIKSCFAAFHVTCARKEHLLLPMKSAQGAEPGNLTVFCDKHLPKEQQEIRAAAAEESSEDDDRVSKSARAHAKTYKTGPPLVPQIILDRLKIYIEKVRIRKPEDFLAMVCRYWSLKREARRGAPLLKRLHLEPWTANRTILQQSAEEKEMKLDQLKRLKEDLTKVKTLTQHMKDRERVKLKQAALIHGVLSACLFSHEPALQKAFADITAIDRQDYFRNPVSKHEVTDYYEVITHPMFWTTIERKLDKHEYWDLQAFKNDILLVVDNAILYNSPGTPYHKVAVKIQAQCAVVFERLETLKTNHQPGPNGFGEIGREDEGTGVEDEREVAAHLEDGSFDTPIDPGSVPPEAGTPMELDHGLEPEIVRAQKVESPMNVDMPADEAAQKVEEETAPAEIPPIAPSILGDLEPPLEMVELLVSSKIIQPGTGLLINPDPISSIFNFELGIPRPKTPPPPRAPKRHKKAEFPSYKPTGAVRRGRGSKTGETTETEESMPPEARVSRKRKRRGDMDVELSELDLEDRSAPPEPKRPRKRRKAVLDAAELGEQLETLPRKTSTSRSRPTPEPEPEPEEEEIPEPVPVSRGRVRKPSKRALEAEAESASPPSPAAAEPETSKADTSLDDKTTFSLFNTGWVLDPDKKRGGRQVAYPEPAPAAKRKRKSRASTLAISTATTENQTLAGDVPVASTSTSRRGRSHMVVDPADLDSHREIIKEGDVTIIQEFETPAIRRAKGLQRRQAREAAKQQSEVSVSVSGSVGESISAPAGNRDGSEPGQASISAPPSKKSRSKQKVIPMVGPDVSMRGIVRSPKKDLVGGTLVWAKVASFPYFPGVIFEDDIELPVKTLRQLEKLRAQYQENTLLFRVKFFDKSGSWALLPAEQLRHLGDDKDLDADMLSPNSQLQPWKGGHLKGRWAKDRKDLLVAHGRVMLEMETKEENDAAEGQGAEEEQGEDGEQEAEAEGEVEAEGDDDGEADEPGGEADDGEVGGEVDEPEVEADGVEPQRRQRVYFEAEDEEEVDFEVD